MAIDTDTAVAVYAAALSTTTAVVGLGRMLRDRPRLEVHTQLVTTTSSGESARGTLIELHEPGLLYECVVAVDVINKGRRAIEVVGVLAEGIAAPDATRVTALEIRPTNLPAVLEPLARIETTIQKEHLDGHEILVFFGVVDALGRRHSAADDDVKRLLVQNQSLPTNLRVYQRRDDPSKKVVAWQSADKTVMSTRGVPTSRRLLNRDLRRLRGAARRAWPRPVSDAASAARAEVRASGE